MTPLDSGLEYAARGWRVFPCRRRSKTPATPHGVKDASREAATVRRTFEAAGSSPNVAIATGNASGLLVVDIDPRNGGRESVDRLQLDHGELPPTAIVSTGGGGSHMYFALPREVRIGCRVSVAGYSGVDIKADGGYVVAPPSLHPSGRRYAWAIEGDLERAPAWLVELARSTHNVDRVAYAAGSLGGIPPRAQALLACRGNVRLRGRFNRDATGLRDVSPSGVDESLATLLALSGLSGAEVEATVRASRARAGLPEKRASYWFATVGRALASALERTHA